MFQQIYIVAPLFLSVSDAGAASAATTTDGYYCRLLPAAVGAHRCNVKRRIVTGGVALVGYLVVLVVVVAAVVVVVLVVHIPPTSTFASCSFARSLAGHLFRKVLIDCDLCRGESSRTISTRTLRLNRQVTVTHSQLIVERKTSVRVPVHSPSRW